MNEDGHVDHIGKYNHGVTAKMSILSEDGRSVVRNDYYKLGKLMKSEIDSDGDMIVEQQKKHDSASIQLDNRNAMPQM